VEDRNERRARFATFSVAFLAALIAFAMNRVQVENAKDRESTGSVLTREQRDFPKSPISTPTSDPPSEVQFG
jgi:hypothetical protein